MVKSDQGVRLARGAALVATSATRLVSASGAVFERLAGEGARFTDGEGTVDTFERVPAAAPAADALSALAGDYVSDEAEITLTAAVDGGALVLKRRPDSVIRLTPLYTDAFSGSIGTVIFRREGGRVTAMSVIQDRVWDLRFTRRPEASRTSAGR
jgi:hypothetical protein